MDKGILEAVVAARSVKSLYGLKRSQLPKVHVRHPSLATTNSIRDNSSLVETLVPCQRVSVAKETEVDHVKWSEQRLPSGMQVYVELEGHVDVTRELQRIEDKLTKTASSVNKLKAKKGESSETDKARYNFILS